MREKTDLEKVKSIARMLLLTPVHKTPYSPVVVQHPFTSSGIATAKKDGALQIIDITESEENLCQGIANDVNNNILETVAQARNPSPCLRSSFRRWLTR